MPMNSLVANLVSVPRECRAERVNNLEQEHFAPYRVDFGFFQQSFFFIVFKSLNYLLHDIRI